MEPTSQKPEEDQIPAGQEQPSNEQTVVEELPTQESTPTTSKKGVLYFLFSPETRTGRFMRPFLRTTALVIGFFGLGLLAGYLLLYRPAQQVIDSTRGNLLTSEQDLKQIRTDNSTLSIENKKLQADLNTAQSRLLVVRVTSDINQARVAIAQKDGKNTQSSLDEASADLNALLPLIRNSDAALATQLEARLTLARSEWNRDPITAETDLKTLAAALNNFENTIMEK